ncbi:MAG TPA: GNAT family N-acetyltransferase [Phenylobacterium sp.]|jgi:GNAT superfamily N-acetyltransferase|uniref:GNAT family N-acetyltransferase n=1 Tax=Phenylobacterium sp. TaxID=1871053 RepID=UPI002C8BBDCD|nr:GNAT family N-acetyltransferase [Phenylobacterium sp.]HXA38920.1 GNAT family N-acetyltransferase [Phenylobacterium sp.]
MPEPSIRRAGPADAPALSALGAATFVETFGHLYPPADLAAFLAQSYNLERTAADLADPAKASWIVEAGGEAVGYALAGPCGLPHAEVTPACGELKRIYLLKAWQNGGLGGRLFAETLGWLQAAGPRPIWIGVWSENHGAQRFYLRHGFEKVGEYGFAVGATVDREYILRRDGVSLAGLAANSASNEHNLA